LKQLLLNKIEELLALVNSISEDNSEAVIAALQAQVADLELQLAAKVEELSLANAKLAEIDLLAKQIDSIA